MIERNTHIERVIIAQGRTAHADIGLVPIIPDADEDELVSYAEGMQSEILALTRPYCEKREEREDGLVLTLTLADEIPIRDFIADIHAYLSQVRTTLALKLYQERARWQIWEKYD